MIRQEGKDGSPSLVETFSTAGIRIVHAGLFDLNGSFRERRIATEDFDELVGVNGTFVNVLPQWDIGERVVGPGPFVGEPIRFDPGSLRTYPFEPDAGVIVADYAGASAELTPRPALALQVASARAHGFAITAALEFEFFVLEEDAAALRKAGFGNVTPYAQENRCWSGESAAIHGEFVQQLNEVLVNGEINPVSVGLELGPGCFEATLRARDAMRAADDAAFFKLFTKAFCRRQGLTAAFMSQLGAGFAGLSGHVHVSFAEERSGRALFPDPRGEHGMSDLFQQFVAGVISLAPEGMALTHHTVNAYRRHSPGNWAPKGATWAPENYSAAARVVTTRDDRCRLEYRLPGSDTNPYLALAYVIGAGLWGIDQQLELGPPLLSGSPDDEPSDREPLPDSLVEAAERLRNSRAIRSIFGDAFVDHHSLMCSHEAEALRWEVSAAERARYLEVV